MPKCQNCGEIFPNRIESGGRMWNLTSRRFCPICSPLGNKNRRAYVVEMEHGNAFCVRCQQQKPREEFYSRKGGGPLSYCKTCQDLIKNLKFEEKMEKAVAMKGGTCADCGNTFPTPVFEFLHEGKRLPLSMVKNMSWERVQRMLGQCEMLCHNCGSLREWERGD